MGKNYKNTRAKPSKQNVALEVCRAEKRTMVFSFCNITKDKDFGLQCLDNAANCATSLFDKLRVMSSQSWEEFWGLGKKQGCEQLPVTAINVQSFVNKLPFDVSNDEKFYVVRFNGQKSRFLFRKGTKCGRVIHIIGIDCNLNLYKH